jgi:aryl sulfotransferase
VHAFYRDWIGGRLPIARDFFGHVKGWWDIRGLPNLLLVHYADLKRDLRGQAQRIADFLEIKPTRWDAIVEHCGFDYMKENGARLLPIAELAWEGGAKTFINKGTNGRWRDVLSAEEIAEYETQAREKLGPECAAWLADGGPVPR